jgi:hypothetical protein
MAGYRLPHITLLSAENRGNAAGSNKAKISNKLTHKNINLIIYSNTKLHHKIMELLILTVARVIKLISLRWAGYVTRTDFDQTSNHVYLNCTIHLSSI